MRLTDPVLRSLGALVLCAAAAAVSRADFEELEARVERFTLPNGLTFLVLERTDAPVFSFRTYVDAGGVDEVPGITGIAHMFEHMAFKGTATVGVTDAVAEARALDLVDAAWDAVAAADSTELEAMQSEFRAAQEAAGAFVKSNDFTKILEEEGAVGLNASTSTDATQYYYSLPSNRLELWARLEGDRLTQPVLREFYKERDVVQEERRFGESSAVGRLIYAFINSAYQAHPYGIGVIGFKSDLQQITRRDAFEFFDKYYVGSNMTIALVGDVRVDEVRRVAEKYFSDVPSGPKPAPIRTVEPRHEAEIRVTLEDPAQPVVFLGYHAVEREHPDYRAYELLGDMLALGRTGRLYERLVKQDKIASDVGGGIGFPGQKYPSMLIFQGIVAKDSEPDQIEAAFYDEFERMVEQGPTEEELRKVKTQNKAAFIRSLRGNTGLAGQLAQNEELFGDYRRLFDFLDDIERVTVDDIRRVAGEALRPGNRVVGVIRRPNS